MRHCTAALPLAIAAVSLSWPAASHALDTDAEARLQLLVREIEALRAETNEKIALLEAEVAALRGGESSAALERAAPGDAKIRRESIDAVDTLSVFGDFRVRYENTAAHSDLRTRNRGVLRARLGARYSFNDGVFVAARLGTGDPDDPNSTDVSLGNFLDDLTVSLDQAYLGYERDRLRASAGKFPNPFTRTEMVWDNDVNPFGVASRYDVYRSEATTIAATGMYGLVDEQTFASDSNVVGGQLSLRSTPAGDWAIGADVAYYDYSIGSLVNANRGDIRGNLLTPDGMAYLSDFDLLNVMSTIRYAGGRWPVRVVGDYVRNQGAAVPEDTGYSLDVFVGDLGDIGNMQFRYGFARVQTDAVLAAFSHDNTTYSTNYRQHTLDIGYRPTDQAYLSLTTYMYRRDDFLLADQPGDNDFVSRVRFNILYQFE